MLGMVMDNTKANQETLDVMKWQQPTWLLLGCQAHALALLIKDLYGVKTVRFAWFKKMCCKALMMSNTINGSETIRTELHQIQQA